MGGKKGQEVARWKEGSLSRRLPGPGPTQAPPGPWSSGQIRDFPGQTRRPPHADLGIWELWGLWLTHLAHVELCIRVQEASELSGAAVEVYIAGPEGGKEAQVIVHWKTEVGIRGVGPVGLLVLDSATLRPEPSPGPPFPTCMGCSSHKCIEKRH